MSVLDYAFGSNGGTGGYITPAVSLVGSYWQKGIGEDQNAITRANNLYAANAAERNTKLQADIANIDANTAAAELANKTFENKFSYMQDDLQYNAITDALSKKNYSGDTNNALQFNGRVVDKAIAQKADAAALAQLKAEGINVTDRNDARYITAFDAAYSNNGGLSRKDTLGSYSKVIDPYIKNDVAKKDANGNVVKDANGNIVYEEGKNSLINPGLSYTAVSTAGL